MQRLGELNEGGDGPQGLGELNEGGNGPNLPGDPPDYLTPGGGGSGPGELPESCDSLTGCTSVEAASVVTGITADDSKLYWVEYGTEDELGNYQYDGRLLARAFDSDEIEVLASDLSGPAGVAVTSTHAFVYLSQDGTYQNVLARLPLGGGELEVVMPDVTPTWTGGEDGGGGPCRHCLKHDGSTAYFPAHGGLYRLAADESVPSQFIDRVPSAFVVHGDSMYARTEEGILKVPLADPVPQLISASPGNSESNLAAEGDFLYAIDRSSDDDTLHFLTRMPTSGGPWVRLPPKRELDRSYYWFQVEINAGLFFHNLYSGGGSWAFVQGVLADPAGSQIVVQLPANIAVYAWVGTPVGIFWIEDFEPARDSPTTEIRHRRLAVE